MKRITRTFPVVVVKAKGSNEEKEVVNSTAAEVTKMFATMGIEIESIAETEAVYGVTEDDFLKVAKKITKKNQ